MNDMLSRLVQAGLAALIPVAAISFDQTFEGRRVARVPAARSGEEYEKQRRSVRL